jgi:hypothetical protein
MLEYIKENRGLIIWRVIWIPIVVAIIYKTSSWIIESNRYEVKSSPIEVEVLSMRTVTETETVSKHQEDVDYLHISFKYKNDVYYDFNLGEARRYKGLVIHDHITLGLHDQYKDGKYERGWINTNTDNESAEMDK